MRPSSQVSNAGKYCPCELAWPDLKGRKTDRDVAGYLVRRPVGGEYRDAGRPTDCDFFRTFAEVNLSRKFRNKMERPLKKSESCLKGVLGNSAVSDHSVLRSLIGKLTLKRDKRQWRPRKA